jgi:hypothetical protein
MLKRTDIRARIVAARVMDHSSGIFSQVGHQAFLRHQR